MFCFFLDFWTTLKIIGWKTAQVTAELHTHSPLVLRPVLSSETILPPPTPLPTGPVWHLHLGLKAVPDYSCPLLSSPVYVPSYPVPPWGLPLRTTLTWAATPSLLPQYCCSPLPWTHIWCKLNSHLATMKRQDGGHRPHICGRGRRKPVYGCTMEPLPTPDCQLWTPCSLKKKTLTGETTVVRPLMRKHTHNNMNMCTV